MSLAAEWWRVEFELTLGLHQGWSQRLRFAPFCCPILHFIFQNFSSLPASSPQKCNTDAFCQSCLSSSTPLPLLFIFPFIALPLPSPLLSRHIFVVLCKPLKAILTPAFFCLSLSFLKPFFFLLSFSLFLFYTIFWITTCLPLDGHLLHLEGSWLLCQTKTQPVNTVWTSTVCHEMQIIFVHVQQDKEAGEDEGDEQHSR